MAHSTVNIARQSSGVDEDEWIIKGSYKLIFTIHGADRSLRAGGSKPVADFFSL